MRLRTVTRLQGANRALLDGSVTSTDLDFDFVKLESLIDGFRSMVRDLAYDVSEMAFATYLCARQHGVRFLAIPVFLVRGFHHGAIAYNERSGIKKPSDLKGRTVGVGRGYTVTTGVWARGILQDEYGLDLGTVNWLTGGDEHVAQFVPPPNVSRATGGQDLAVMLGKSEIDAAVNVGVAHPDVKPLVPAPGEAALHSLETRGLYPINHVIVIREELVHENPGLATEVFLAFASAKAKFMAELKSGRAKGSNEDTLRQVMKFIDDPLPYGVEPNRQMIELLIQHTLDQGIVHDRVEPEQLFAAETIHLAA